MAILRVLRIKIFISVKFYMCMRIDANVFSIFDIYIVLFDMKYKSSYNPPKNTNGGNYGEKLE
jgi:hypothetical protein